MAVKSTTSDELVLYKRRVFLDKSFVFSRFVKAVDEINVSPYLLLIEKTRSKYSFHIETVFIHPLYPIAPFADYVLLNNCIVRYSRNKKEVLLEGYHDSEWFLQLLILFSFLIASDILVMVLRPGIIPLLIIVITLAIPLSIYRRDVRRFEKIVLLAIASATRTRRK